MMPIYEYRCIKCNKILEFIQSINDDPLTEDPSCLEKPCQLKKQISNTSFKLKGDGWYKDGYSKPFKSND